MEALSSSTCIGGFVDAECDDDRAPPMAASTFCCSVTKSRERFRACVSWYFSLRRTTSRGGRATTPGDGERVAPDSGKIADWLHIDVATRARGSLRLRTARLCRFASHTRPLRRHFGVHSHGVASRAGRDTSLPLSRSLSLSPLKLSALSSTPSARLILYLALTLANPEDGVTHGWVEDAPSSSARTTGRRYSLHESSRPLQRSFSLFSCATCAFCLPLSRAPHQPAFPCTWLLLAWPLQRSRGPELSASSADALHHSKMSHGTVEALARASCACHDLRPSPPTELHRMSGPPFRMLPAKNALGVGFPHHYPTIEGLSRLSLVG